MARHLHRPAGLRRAGVELDHHSAAGNAAAQRAQVSCPWRGGEELPLRADEPADLRLRAGCRQRAGNPVRLRSVFAADLHGHLRARPLFSAGLCRHRDRDRGRRLPQLAHRRPLRHAHDLAYCTRRPVGRRHRHAGCSPRWMAVPAPVHDPVHRQLVCIRADVLQFLGAGDGTSGTYRGNGLVAVRIDHNADWNRGRYCDRTDL